MKKTPGLRRIFKGKQRNQENEQRRARAGMPLVFLRFFL